MRWPFPARPRVFRLLRAGVRALGRIADALEEQNRLQTRLHAHLLQPAPLDERPASEVSYVNPEEVRQVEATRERLYHQTGRLLDDDELLAYLATSGELRQ